MGKTVDIEAFEDLLDRQGEDISRWCSADRQAASHFLSSPDAWTVLEESFALRTALKARPVYAPTGLLDRIVCAATGTVS